MGLVCVSTAVHCSVSDSPPNPCYDKLSQHSVEEFASAAHHICSHMALFLMHWNSMNVFDHHRILKLFSYVFTNVMSGKNVILLEVVYVILTTS